MVALNMPIVNDIEPKRDKPVPKEHVSLNCRYGLVDGYVICFPGATGKLLEKFVDGSNVTIYAGPDKKPVVVNVGYRVWNDDVQKYIFQQVFIRRRSDAISAIENFLAGVLPVERLVDLSFDGGVTYHCNVKIPADCSIMQVANYILTPPSEPKVVKSMNNATVI